jgi:alkane 1-monooxygenase
MQSRINTTYADMFALILYAIPLHISTMGTNVGHELTHRKREKFDMFIGNWLLALSWDCTFAVEHVYGHHKNVGLKDDPATASRNESLYMFIIRGTLKAHKDAWKIEIDRLKRSSSYPFSLKNKMILGYFRSAILSFIAFSIGGYVGLLIFILWGFIAKSYLETINFIEHYGLVRVPGEPVMPRHSWNSNHVLSSYPDAPTLPYGYLHCLYVAFFVPFLFKKMMKPKLKEWDENFASEKEKEILTQTTL